MPPAAPPKPAPQAPAEGAEALGRHPGEPPAHFPACGGSRKGATQARARETVDAILEAAARILEKEGYRAASTNAIARRAGVSVGSLYQYFSSREDVFQVLAARHRGAVHPIVTAAMTRLGTCHDRPSQVLAELLRDLLEAHGDRPALMHALETDLARVLPTARIMEEAQEVEAAARVLASRAAGPPEEALAKAWLAAEITALVSRKLAHDAPAWVAVTEVRAAYTRIMAALVD